MKQFNLALVVIGCGIVACKSASSTTGTHGAQGSSASKGSSSGPTTGAGASTSSDSTTGSGGSGPGATGTGGTGGSGAGSPASSGAGAGSTTGGTGGNTGRACNFSFGVCQQPHEVTDETQFDADCGMVGGTPTAGCPTANLLGTCDRVILGTKVIVYYYTSSGYTVTALQSTCTSHGGTWQTA